MIIPTFEGKTYEQAFAEWIAARKQEEEAAKACSEAHRAYERFDPYGGDRDERDLRLKAHAELKDAWTSASAQYGTAKMDTDIAGKTVDLLRYLGDCSRSDSTDRHTEAVHAHNESTLTLMNEILGKVNALLGAQTTG